MRAVSAERAQKMRTKAPRDCVLRASRAARTSKAFDFKEVGIKVMAVMCVTHTHITALKQSQPSHGT